MTNEHTNEPLDYCQHSTPQFVATFAADACNKRPCLFSSEGSSSPVPRAEAVINRTTEPIVQRLANTSLHNVQTYPPSTSETSVTDNIDHYHHQPTSDV